MGANKSRFENEAGPSSRGGQLELFYYERRGDRYYLRITPLAVLLVAGLAAVSIAAVLVIFLFRDSRGDLDNVNINVVTPPASPLPANTPLIKQLPPLSPPKVNRPQPAVVPMPSALPTQNGNVNSQAGTTPTPGLDSSKPPT